MTNNNGKGMSTDSVKEHCIALISNNFDCYCAALWWIYQVCYTEDKWWDVSGKYHPSAVEMLHNSLGLNQIFGKDICRHWRIDELIAEVSKKHNLPSVEAAYLIGKKLEVDPRGLFTVASGQNQLSAPENVNQEIMIPDRLLVSDKQFLLWAYEDITDYNNQIVQSVRIYKSGSDKITLFAVRNIIKECGI